MANTKISALTSATIPLAGTEILPIVQSSTTKQVSIANITAGRSVSALALSTTAGMVDVRSSSGIGVRFIETSSGNTNRVQLGTATGIGYVDVDSGAGSIQMDLKVSGATKYTIDATGNLIPAGAAKGVNFTANTPASGMTSQLLNWYEEGTGTATRSGFTEVIGAGSITSTYYYTRIGRAVFMNITLVCAGGATIAWGGAGTAAFTGLPFSSPRYAIGQWMNNTNLATTGPTGWISTTMYVAGPAATVTTNNSFSFSGTFNV